MDGQIMWRDDDDDDEGFDDGGGGGGGGAGEEQTPHFSSWPRASSSAEPRAGARAPRNYKRGLNEHEHSTHPAPQLTVHSPRRAPSRSVLG